MKILVVTTWYPDNRAPSRTPFVGAHVEAIRSQGHDVTVVHLDRQGAALTVTRSGGRPVRTQYDDPRRFRRLRALLRAIATIRRGLHDHDLIHTMAFSSLLLTALPWLALRRRRPPWVHTEHWNGVTNPAAVSAAWSRLAWLRHVLRLPNVVTGVTVPLCDAMGRFARRGAVTVVPCVVDVGTPRPHPARPPLRLVSVGLLIERKDPLLTIRVVRELVDRGIEVHLTWVGDGPLRRPSQELVADLDLTNRVHLTGAVRPDTVRTHLAGAHLFLLPSHQENFLTAAAESLAAGRPVVLTPCGGFTDYCDTSNSVIARSWDIDDLADAVVLAAAQFDHADPDAIAGPIARRFSPAAVGAAFSEIYSELGRRASNDR